METALEMWLNCVLSGLSIFNKAIIKDCLVSITYHRRFALQLSINFELIYIYNERIESKAYFLNIIY